MNKQKIIKEIKGYLFMCIGCLSYAISTVVFLAPNSIVAGGVTGLSTLIYLLTDGKALIGVVSVLINLPIFILGWRYTGWKFIVRSLITVATLGLVTDLLEANLVFTNGPIADPLLSSLYGGVCQGIGIGLFVKYEFSSGGTELFGRLLYKWFKIASIPVWVGILDAIIVIAGAVCLVDLNNILYALIVIVVSTKLSEIILVGLEKSKLCIVVTNKGEEVSDNLIKRSPRGITLLEGRGMYTHQDRQVLISCVKNRQLSQFRQIVHESDANAFVIISDSNEVRGKGFKGWEE